MFVERGAIHGSLRAVIFTGKLVVAIIQEAETDAAIGAGADDSGRRAGDEFPSLRKDDYIALDAERTIENEQAVLKKIGGRVGVSFENADARLAALGDGPGQSYFEEEIIVSGACGNFAGGLGVLASDGFKLQILAGAAFDDAFFRGCGTGANGIEKIFCAFAGDGDVVSDGELVRFRRQKFVKSEIVRGKGRDANEEARLARIARRMIGEAEVYHEAARSFTAPLRRRRRCWRWRRPWSWRERRKCRERRRRQARALPARCGRNNR